MSTRPTDALIKTEADRLLALPANPGDSTELARALKRHATTAYHVKAIVQHLLDVKQFYPTPSAVKDAAEICLAEAPPKYRPTDPQCPKCAGTGFKHAMQGGYSCVTVCDCRLIGAPRG